MSSFQILQFLPTVQKVCRSKSVCCDGLTTGPGCVPCHHPKYVADRWHSCTKWVWKCWDGLFHSAPSYMDIPLGTLLNSTTCYIMWFKAVFFRRLCATVGFFIHNFKNKNRFESLSSGGKWLNYLDVTITVTLRPPTKHNKLDTWLSIKNQEF